MRRKTPRITGDSPTKKEKPSAREIGWDKLDNTAHIFPVIAGEDMTSVYRISVTLTEEIEPQLLQQALDTVLPRFRSFDLRLRAGLFWYYFERNGKKAPRVQEERHYPCRFIHQNKNRNYLFRVTYYKCRINLEVFHVLTDGMGGLSFIKELCFQYLRLKYPRLQAVVGDGLSPETSLNREDSFMKNFRRKAKIGYAQQRAYLIKGERLAQGRFGVMHGYLDIPELKALCKSRGVTINEYLVSVFIWSVYTELLGSAPCEKPIRVAVPVNLRPYFDSITSKNFFVMVSAQFKAERYDHSFEEILSSVARQLREAQNRDNLERLMSYNVANEKRLICRLAPLPLKYPVMRRVYNSSALANTSTITNIGLITVDESYRPYIEAFHAYLPASRGQHIRGTVCSYGDKLSFSFGYDIKDVSVQRGFFRRLSADGLTVELESNGVNYE